MLVLLNYWRTYVYLFSIEFILFTPLTSSIDIGLPNLPFGEYGVILNKFYPCESTKNHLIILNGIFSRKSTNIFEYKGDIFLKVPFDNTFDIDINIASWGTIGGWKDNAVVIKSPRACDTGKRLLGEYWSSMRKEFGIQTRNCPLPAGTYTTTGIEVKPNELNFPKIFFYGKYKMSNKFVSRNRTLLGCFVSEFELVRPWELPKQ